MKQVGFFEGVGVALLAGIGGSALFGILTAVFTGGFALRIIIAIIGLFYVLYLLHRSGEKVGRITTFVTWLISAALIWLLGLNLPLYLMAHLGLIWLTRLLFFYSSFISALFDLGLVLLGMAAASWAALETGNFFLSIWSFFLVQALFAVIPKTWKRPRKSNAIGNIADDRFQLAYRAAETAVSKLSTLR